MNYHSKKFTVDHADLIKFAAIRGLTITDVLNEFGIKYNTYTKHYRKTGIPFKVIVDHCFYFIVEQDELTAMVNETTKQLKELKKHI